jgi:hypothetical protein
MALRPQVNAPPNVGPQCWPLMLAQWHAHDQAVEFLRHRYLAGQARILRHAIG